MNAAVAPRRYALDGVRLRVRTGDETLEAMLHARLRRLQVEDAEHPTDPDAPARLTIDLRADDELTPSERERLAFGRGRAVYDPPVGEVRYDAAADRLLVRLTGQVDAVCEPTLGRALIVLRTGAPTARWYASHPVFTLCLLELLREHRRQPLHAAALAIDGHGLIIPGRRGAGKSTLTLALVRGGFDLLGDDHCFMVADAAGQRVAGFPDEIDVTESTIGFFPELAFLLERERHPGTAKRQLRMEDVYRASHSAACRPAALVFPSVGESPRSALVPLAPAEALLELTPNVLLTSGARAQAHLDALGALVRDCPAYRLTTGRDFDDLPAMLRGLL